MGNNGTNRRTSPANMDMFDKLPKAAREALRYADHNWNGEQLYRAWKGRRHGLRTAADCVLAIRAQDVKTHLADATSGLVCGGQENTTRR